MLLEPNSRQWLGGVLRAPSCLPVSQSLESRDLILRIHPNYYGISRRADIPMVVEFVLVA